MSYEVINGEALTEMSKLAERGVTVDACITDPPYGTTACAWDAVIPFEPMWANLKRLVKRDGAIVLFGSQPFTSALVMSNPGMFKYSWVWLKNRPSNFQNSGHQPLRDTEDIAVFYDNPPTYNPQLRPTRIKDRRIVEGRANGTHGTGVDRHGFGLKLRGLPNAQKEMVSPGTFLEFPCVPHSERVHASQKPVELMRYLVRTYTNPGDTVLDFTAGSFTTGVACVIEGRNFIGIEQSAEYCAIGEARMKRASGIPADIPKLHRRQLDAPLFGGAL